jgi:hypothetical protein
MRKLGTGAGSPSVSRTKLSPARHLVFGASKLATRVLDSRGEPEDAWVTSIVDATSGCIYASVLTPGVPLERHVGVPLRRQLLRSIDRQGRPKALTPLSGPVDLPIQVRKVLVRGGIPVDDQLSLFAGPSEIEIVAKLIDEADIGRENDCSLVTADALQEQFTSWLHTTYHSKGNPLFERVRMNFVSSCCGS